MRNIIERYIKSSIQGDIYEKALDCLKVLREVCVKEDEAAVFNQFLQKVKQNHSNGEHLNFFKML